MIKKKADLTISGNQKKLTENNSQAISYTINFPVVGIGASAGGLEALEQFFQNMPHDSGMAFVIIQHLDPYHISMMHELLQRTTLMKVLQVNDRMPVKPNHVYVIPPNKTMSIFKGFFYLFEPLESRGLRLPIDYFFRSLAQEQNEKSVGVILSGMGSDGSLGVKAIKERNGIVLVQDPLTAKFDAMPKSAVNAVNVDILSAANELPQKLIALLRYSRTIVQKDLDNDKNKSNIEKVLILLRAQNGHDFSLYKESTLFRRIERRMNIHQIDKIADYVRFLQANPNELDILFKELLIGVTKFFRDQPVWELLREKVLPELFNELPDGYVLRAWIPACSTGEEAYSLAIIFKEALDNVKMDKNLSLQIFATDIDRDAINKARKGYFNANIVSDVSAARLNRFFVKEEDGFRINTTIREMIVFAHHSVIKDTPFTKLDFLSCRNLLIYMKPELQKKLMNLFHYSLNAGGIMLLGSAENENSQSNRFITVDSKLKFYKSNIIPVNTDLTDFPLSFNHNMKKTGDKIKAMKHTDNIQSITDQLLLQSYTPPSVLINPEGDILNITGRTGKYLEPAAGKANMNIYAMSREGLQNELPSAIRKAKQNYDAVILHNLKIGTNESPYFVNVSVQQVEKPAAIKGNILIVFKEIPQPTKRKSKKQTKDSSLREQELEIELQVANEELKKSREEMQITQEELKSSNEEMQSTNEELQSSNEELTTSKEEMQSLNEELQTVNAELQEKISDYVQADNDMKNLLNSTDIATLFLDKELNIRRFTDQTMKLFKLRQTDIGRPFTDIISDLQYPEIAEHARGVLRTLLYKETEIATNDLRWFTVRIMPYLTYDDRIDGLVITFIDITKAKKSETLLAAANTKEKGKIDENLISANEKVIALNLEIKQLKTELKKAKDMLRKHNIL